MHALLSWFHKCGGLALQYNLSGESIQASECNLSICSTHAPEWSIVADHRLKIMGSEVVGYMFQCVRSAVPAHLL